MKYARIGTVERDSLIAELRDDRYWPILDDQQRPYLSMRNLIHDAMVGNREVSSRGAPVLAGDARLLTPISAPNKVFCIGLNYQDHARETGATVGEVPVVFSKFASALIATNEPIVLPRISQQVDFEAELVVVIGRPGKNIPVANATEHVFGYCCGNDVSARDWQKGKPGGQWLLGKTFDTFGPIGPCITTADEIGWPVSLNVQSILNGQVMQSSNTRQFIFPIDFLISHLSQFCELAVGDLIFTGTPSGVGVARNPPVFLQPGDTIEVSIDGLGSIANPVIASSGPPAP